MKDDEIFVLDNIVSLATQNLIERLVRESVSWKFIPNVAYVDGRPTFERNSRYVANYLQ